jgi:peptide/nickel transport system permease protein
MLGFIARRVGAAVVVLLILAAVMFGLQRTSKADPVRAKLGIAATPELVAEKRHELGYDRPIVVQYVDYVRKAATGDLGTSIRTNRPVSDDLRVFLPASIELITAIMIVASVIGVTLGIITARPGGGSGVVRVVMLFLSSAPGFLLTLLGILFFYRRLGVLPASGRTSFVDAPTGPTGFLTVDGLIHGRVDVTTDAVNHLILPAVAAAIVPAAAIARVLRASLLSTMGSDQIRTARAKGLGEGRIMRRHALRNSAGPTLSLVGLLVASLFAGTLIVEQIVAWPGLGAYMLRSVNGKDFPAIAGVTLVVGAIYITLNMVVEIVQSILDPRIRAV